MESCALGSMVLILEPLSHNLQKLLCILLLPAYALLKGDLEHTHKRKRRYCLFRNGPLVEVVQHLLEALGAVLAHAARIGLPFAPGIMGPSELQIALRHGCEMVKFFPAMPAGGPSMLKNIAAPYAHTGIGFNPTGGVTPENLPDWLALPQVRAVGGTWIARRDDIAAGNWDVITENARAALARVRDIRGA